MEMALVMMPRRAGAGSKSMRASGEQPAPRTWKALAAAASRQRSTAALARRTRCTLSRKASKPTCWRPSSQCCRARWAAALRWAPSAQASRQLFQPARSRRLCSLAAASRSLDVRLRLE